MRPQFQLSDLRVIPASIVRIRCGPGWSLGPEWASELRDYDLWYVWGGVGHMITSVGTIDLKPGVGVWMSPGRRYEAMQDPRRRLCVSAVHFNLTYRGRTLHPSEFRPPVEVFESSNPGYFEEVMAHVVRLCSSSRDDVVPGLLMKALLLELADAAGAQWEEETPLHRHHRQKLSGMLAEVRNQPEKAYRVRKFAVQCGYSPDHFARIFRSITGHTPKEFILKARMERAAALLRESSHTVTQTADLLGYQDLAFFSRQFRHYFGVNPRDFRKGSQSSLHFNRTEDKGGVKTRKAHG